MMIRRIYALTLFITRLYLYSEITPCFALVMSIAVFNTLMQDVFFAYLFRSQYDDMATTSINFY